MQYVIHKDSILNLKVGLVAYYLSTQFFGSF